MLSSQAFEWENGPAEAPYQATEEGDGKSYVYRVLRRYENPWEMREPPDTDIADDEFRALLVTAIAHGNDLQGASPFLHTTANLSKAIRIVQERRPLYSNWLCRWKKTCTEHRIDFCDKKDQQKWLSEHDDDNELIRDAVKSCRSYVQKYAEVVYLRHLGDANVTWWDEFHKKWRKLSDVPQSFQTTAKSQNPKRTPSEESRDVNFAILQPDEAWHS